jgi:hypothetical protein
VQANDLPGVTSGVFQGLAPRGAAWSHQKRSHQKRIAFSSGACRPESIDYLGGGRDTFSSETVEVLNQAKYRAALSFYNRLNGAGSIAPLDIQRCGMGMRTREFVCLQAAMGSLTGNLWFWRSQARSAGRRAPGIRGPPRRCSFAAGPRGAARAILKIRRVTFG